jgi:hypothetical protein
VSVGTPSIIDRSAIVISRSSASSFITCSVLVRGIALREHSFGLPAKPLKDKQLLSAFGGAQDRVAVGPISPTIELASSNFQLASQRPEVQIGAAGFGARLAQWPRDSLEQDHPRGPMRLRLWQRPALRWNSRSPPAPSTHAVADVAHYDARCLTLSGAV